MSDKKPVTVVPVSYEEYKALLMRKSQTAALVGAARPVVEDLADEHTAYSEEHYEMHRGLREQRAFIDAFKALTKGGGDE